MCTTIIESGLDIPNANTIIVDRADALGLAQLYQLRGRVGRSSRRAWCYLLYRHEDALSEVARKRLKAIFDASHLGAGFQLALADLEIRGAGDLLGGEQSGHIAAVGFDLYSQLLAESVQRRRAERDGRPVPRPTRTTIIDLPVAAHLAEAYVADAGQRLDLYRRLGVAASAEEVTAIGEELRDRFGPLPPAAERLLEVANLRTDASAAGVVSLLMEEGHLAVRLGDLPRAVGAKVAAGMPGVPLALEGNLLRSRGALTPAAAWDLARGVVAALRAAAPSAPLA